MILIASKNIAFLVDSRRVETGLRTGQESELYGHDRAQRHDLSGSHVKLLKEVLRQQTFAAR